MDDMQKDIERTGCDYTPTYSVDDFLKDIKDSEVNFLDIATFVNRVYPEETEKIAFFTQVYREAPVESLNRIGGVINYCFNDSKNEIQIIEDLVRLSLQRRDELEEFKNVSIPFKLLSSLFNAKKDKAA